MGLGAKSNGACLLACFLLQKMAKLVLVKDEELRGGEKDEMVGVFPLEVGVSSLRISGRFLVFWVGSSDETRSITNKSIVLHFKLIGIADLKWLNSDYWWNNLHISPAAVLSQATLILFLFQPFISPVASVCHTDACPQSFLLKACHRASGLICSAGSTGFISWGSFPLCEWRNRIKGSICLKWLHCPLVWWSFS